MRVAGLVAERKAIVRPPPSTDRMTVRLTSNETRRLIDAAIVLAAPAAQPTLRAWREQCNRVIGALLNSERSAGILPVDGEPLVVQTRDMDEPARAWTAYYCQHDTALMISGRATALGAFHLLDLYERTTLQRSEFYADWVVPHQVQNAFGMVTQFGSGPFGASLHAYPMPRAITARRGCALLALLRPAFEAGVQAVAFALGGRTDILRALSAGCDGVLLVDQDGRTVHCSPEFAALMSDDRTRAALDPALQQMLQRVRALLRPPGKVHREPIPSVVQGLVAQVGDHRLRAILLDGYTRGGEALIAVTVTRQHGLVVDDTRSRARFGLTHREAAVARELASGRSSRDIAERLGVTVFTVRRHTERVFEKLGVTTRAAVGPRIQAE